MSEGQKIGLKKPPHALPVSGSEPDISMHERMLLMTNSEPNEHAK